MPVQVNKVVEDTWSFLSVRQHWAGTFTIFLIIRHKNMKNIQSCFKSGKKDEIGTFKRRESILREIKDNEFFSVVNCLFKY